MGKTLTDLSNNNSNYNGINYNNSNLLIISPSIQDKDSINYPLLTILSVIYTEDFNNSYLYGMGISGNLNSSYYQTFCLINQNIYILSNIDN